MAIANEGISATKMDMLYLNFGVSYEGVKLGKKGKTTLKGSLVNLKACFDQLLGIKCKIALIISDLENKTDPSTSKLAK